MCFRKCLQIELWKTALLCSPAHSLPTKPQIIALPFFCPQNLSSGIIDFLQFKSARIFEKRLRPFEPGLWSPTVIVLPISLWDETMPLAASSHKLSFALLTSCSMIFWGAQQQPSCLSPKPYTSAICCTVCQCDFESSLPEITLSILFYDWLFKKINIF